MTFYGFCTDEIFPHLSYNQLMTTRENVFDVLSRSEGEAVSGEKLAEICGVSRAAIWKAVKSLREEGFIIEGTTNGGYVYNGESDVLSAEAVKTFLASAYPNLNSASVECFKTIDSTNTYAKKLLADGDRLKLDKRIIVAESQTQGRGRLGRTFCSPEKTGIYLTMIHIPKEFNADPAKITASAAVAVCRAVQRLFKVEPKIKWINDIYLDGKKIAGILTEGFINFETSAIDAAVIGIGINISGGSSQFPKDVAKVAGSILQDEKAPVTRSQLAAEVSGEVLSILDEDPKAVMREYQSLSFLIGKTVKVHPVIDSAAGVYEAKVTGIDDDARLLVKLQDGTTKALLSGEVSLHQD